MTLESELGRPSPRMGNELWSWAAGLTLFIVSYPAVLVARLSPWAGLVGGLTVGAFLAARAGLGYAGWSGLDVWRRGVSLCLVAAAAVGATAALLDRSNATITATAALLTACEMLFTWHFLPAMVRDAEASELDALGRYQLLPLVGRPGTLTRPALGLALLLAFIMLGAGAIWHHAEHWAPNPAGWFVGVTLLSLALMFVERLNFFERSAREGNLVVPRGSFRRWVGAALMALLIATVLGLAGPRRTAQQREETRPPGSATVVRSPGASTRLHDAGPLRGPRPTPQEVAITAAERRRTLVLLLLLLLLLLLIVLIWGFSRSRAARWLLALVATALSRLLGAWKRFMSAMKRWLFPEPRHASEAEPSALAEEADPFFDVFEHPELLRTLTPRQILIRTYHLMLNFAALLGYGRRAGQTPFEYAHELLAEAPGARDGVRALTWGYAGAMYAEQGISLPDPNAVRLAWRQTADALKGDMSAEDFNLRRRAYLAARKLESGSRH